MKLHEIEKEIQAIEAMEKRIRKETPIVHEETKHTLSKLKNAKMKLEVQWWDKLRAYTYTEMSV